MEPQVLFDFIKPPPAPRRRRRAVLEWLAGKRRRFSFFIAVSCVAHLALFGMVALFGPQAGAPSDAKDPRAMDLRVFKESMQEYASDGRTPARLANALIALSEEDIEKAFRQAPVLDYRLSDREKAGLYKTMLMEAAAEFTEGPEEGPSALDLPLSRYFGSLREMPVAEQEEGYTLVRIDDPLQAGARIFMLSKERDEALRSLGLAGPEVKDRSAEVELLDGEGRLRKVPGEYFYRDSPYRQIAAAGAGLFYIIKGFPEPPPPGTGNVADQRKAGAPRPETPSRAFSVFLVPTGGPRDRAPKSPAGQPVPPLSEREIERILDGLMPLSVAEQVRTFYRDHLEGRDPDSAELARLTGGFLYRNLGMIFIRTGDPLSRGFDLLEELYYDNLSLDALVPYAMEHPRSRTGAEILLCLAASYEFERRTIVALDGSLDAVKRVLADPTGARLYVHNKDVKAYVLREVYRDLAAGLRERGYPALDAVLQKYRDEQLRIYDLLTAMGGEIRCRAQYALGRLYWDEGRAESALLVWRDTDPAFADVVLTGIRGAIIERRRPLDAVPAIDVLLGRQTVSEKTNQLARIMKFHKWDRR
jgi:hypothetical protein